MIISAAKVNMGITDAIILTKWIKKTFKRFYQQNHTLKHKLCQ